MRTNTATTIDSEKDIVKYYINALGEMPQHQRAYALSLAMEGLKEQVVDAAQEQGLLLSETSWSWSFEIGDTIIIGEPAYDDLGTEAYGDIGEVMEKTENGNLVVHLSANRDEDGTETPLDEIVILHDADGVFWL